MTTYWTIDAGPGAYLPGTAKRVTRQGQIYAVDLHPLAVQRVRELARRRGLPDTSIDNVQAANLWLAESGLRQVSWRTGHTDRAHPNR